MKHSILVIEESSPTSRERVISTLTKVGFEVATATSTEEVLSRRDELKPQLIVLGEGLPVDSFEACCQLRRAVDVPVLMVGTVPSDEAWIGVVRAGAAFYLVKPFSYIELVARVKAIIRRHEHTNNKNHKGRIEVG